MVPLSDLKPYIQPYLIGLSDPAIERVLIDSAKEFADRTGVVRETVIAPVTAGDESILPTTASNMEDISGVISVEVNGSTTTFTNYFSKIKLGSAVAEDGTAEIECWTRPSYGADSLNDVLANNYREGIVSGAVMRGKMLPGEAQDPNGANTHYQLFEKAISQAKYDMASQKTAKTITKNPQRFI